MFTIQKWSKGKMKEKVNNQVLFDQVTSSDLCSNKNYENQAPVVC